MGASAPINLWQGFKFDNPAQMDFLKSKAKYRLLSSGRGGGKSVVGCRESIRCAIMFPGSRNMIARLKSTELEASTHITFKRELRSIGFMAGQHYEFNKNDRTYRWFNGSETILSHLEDEEKFGSVELSTIFVDEGSQVPDSVYQMIFPANLRWDVGPHRAWFCTNPGASGWLRDIVYGKATGTGRVEKHQTAGGSVETVVDEYAWFPVAPGMNRHNPGGQAYFDDLATQGKRYGPHWLARYHDGSWDSFEGQRFPMFDRDIHVLKTPWQPTSQHIVVEGIDFGFRETFVTWMAFKPDGSEPIVVFDELQAQEVLEPKMVSDRVFEIRRKHGLDSTKILSLGDPAGVAASTFSAVSPIMAYAGLGWYISPCKKGKSPTSRADLLTAHLTDRKTMIDGSEWPGIVFSPTCLAVVDSIVNLRWDVSSNTKGEDPRERFIKKNDHGFDSLSYGLVGVPPPAILVPKDPFRGMQVSVGAREAFAGAT